MFIRTEPTQFFGIDADEALYRKEFTKTRVVLYLYMLMGG